MSRIEEGEPSLLHAYASNGENWFDVGGPQPDSVRQVVEMIFGSIQYDEMTQEMWPQNWHLAETFAPLCCPILVV